MHQKGYKAAVNKAKSVIKDNAEKEDTGTANIPDRHQILSKLQWKGDHSGVAIFLRKPR